jgi:uncharacterized protein
MMADPDRDGKIFVGKSDKPEMLALAFGNRHGLVTGATGTGKTVTLQTIAEGFSRAGVPVFAADIKGDLSGIAAPGEAREAFVKRAKDIGFEYETDEFLAMFWDLFGEQGHPIRATVFEVGPLLLSRILDLNDVQEGVINIVFRYADDEFGKTDAVNKGLIDIKDLREVLSYISSSDDAKAIGARYGNVAQATVGAVQRQLLVLENQGATKFVGEPALDDEDGPRRPRLHQHRRRRQADGQPAPLCDVPAVAVVGHVREAARGRRPRQAQAGVLLRRGASAVHRRAQGAARQDRAGGAADPLQGRRRLFRHPEPARRARQGSRPARKPRAACVARLHPARPEAVRAAAETFRPNPKLNTAQVITELGKGEALVSFLEGNGTPSMVDRTLIRPPSARVGLVSAEERKAIIAKSPLRGKYDTPVDPESAFEILQKRVHGGTAGGEPGRAGEGGGLLGTLGSIFGGGASGARRGRMSTSEVVAKQVARSVATKVGNEVGRAIVRGVLGSLGGKGR